MAKPSLPVAALWHRFSRPAGALSWGLWPDAQPTAPRLSPGACWDTGGAGGVAVPAGMSPHSLPSEGARWRGPKGWRGPGAGRASGMGARGLGLWWLMSYNGEGVWGL